MKTNPNATLIADCQALKARIQGDGKNLSPHRDVAIGGLQTAIDCLTWEYPAEEKSLAKDSKDAKPTDNGPRTTDK